VGVRGMIWVCAHQYFTTSAKYRSGHIVGEKIWLNNSMPDIAIVALSPLKKSVHVGIHLLKDIKCKDPLVVIALIYSLVNTDSGCLRPQYSLIQMSIHL
jgi:hypothetical protein